MTDDRWLPLDGPHAQWLIARDGRILGHVADDFGKWRAFCPQFYHLDTYKTPADARAEVERVIRLEREKKSLYV